MGKAIIILLVGTAVVLSLLNLSMIERNNQATGTSTSQFGLKQSRLIATSMVNMDISKLSDDPKWRQTTASKRNLFDGTVTSKVVDTLIDNKDMIKVTADGNFYGTTATVTALIKAPNLLPPYLDYAIFGGEEVKFNGTNIKVRDANDPTLNTNVHSNDKVTFDGSQQGVEGFVTYKNSITLGSASIIPNNNPNGLPVHDKANIPIPSINPASYQGIAHQTIAGGTINGLTLGTKENPKIIFVNGSASLKGTVTGYGILVVKGGVQMAASLIHSDPHPEYSKLFIITGGKFELNNANTTVHATVFAKDEVVINAQNAVILGGLVSLKKVTLNAQNIDLRYKPLLSNLSDPLFGQQAPTKRLEVVHWNE